MAGVGDSSGGHGAAAAAVLGGAAQVSRQSAPTPTVTQPTGTFGADSHTSGSDGAAASIQGTATDNSQLSRSSSVSSASSIWDEILAADDEIAPAAPNSAQAAAADSRKGPLKDILEQGYRENFGRTPGQIRAAFVPDQSQPIYDAAYKAARQNGSSIEQAVQSGLKAYDQSDAGKKLDSRLAQEYGDAVQRVGDAQYFTSFDQAQKTLDPTFATPYNRVKNLATSISDAHGDYDKVAQNIRNTLIPQKYQAQFDHDYQDGLHEFSADHKLALHYALSKYDATDPRGRSDLSSEFDNADKAVPLTPSPIQKTAIGDYTDNAATLQSVTTDGDFGKYHNAINERNKQFAALSAAKGQGVADADLGAITAKIRNADDTARSIYNKMTTGQKQAAGVEDGKLGLTMTPATNETGFGDVAKEIVKVMPSYANAEAAAQIGDAASQAGKAALACGAGADAAGAAAANAAKTAAEAISKAGGPLGLAAGAVIGVGFDAKSLSDAMRSGDKSKTKDAGIALGADVATLGLYSWIKSLVDFHSTSPTGTIYDVKPPENTFSQNPRVRAQQEFTWYQQHGIKPHHDP